MSNQLFEIVKWLTPVAIFFLGFILNALFNRIKDCWSRKHKREFILLTVESLISRSAKQVLEIQRVIKNLHNINNTDILIAHVTGDEFTDIKEVEFEDYYKMFYSKRRGIKEEKLSDFRSFRDNVAFIEELFSATFLSNKETLDRIISQAESFNKSYFKAINCVNEFVNELNQSTKTNKIDDFAVGCTKTLKSIYENYGKVINEIDVIYQEGILKLKEVCREHKDDSRSVRLLGIIQQAEAAYLTIDVNRKQGIRHLEMKSEQMVRSNQTLNNTIKKFKISKYKC